MEQVLSTFQRFRDLYAAAYAAEHQQAKSGGVFEAYEQLNRSRRYGLLKRLDQLSMISVEHDRRSVDQRLSAVLLPALQPRGGRAGANRGRLQLRFSTGREALFPGDPGPGKSRRPGDHRKPERAPASASSEKILPYLEGLRQVGKDEEAEEVRELLKLAPEGAEVVEALGRRLTPRVISHVNEAFRGKVIVVRRDLDRLYQSLVHRKYTLAQTRRILREWLGEAELSEETYLSLPGAGLGERGGPHHHPAGGNAGEKGPGSTRGGAGNGLEDLSRSLVTVLWAAQYGLSGWRSWGCCRSWSAARGRTALCCSSRWRN